MEEETKDEGTVVSDIPDELSKQIAEDVAKENQPEKTGEEKNNEEDAEPEKKEEAPEKKEEPEKQPEKKVENEEVDTQKKIDRTPKLIPAWKHEAYKNQSEKEKEELRAKIIDLETKSSGKTDAKQQEMIKKLAEENGFTENFVTGLIEIMGVPKLKKEFEEKLGSIEQERMANIQKSEFSKEYEKDVLPLLKDSGIPQERWDGVKKRLSELAFTEEYAKTPLKVIFKGVDEFEDYKKVPGKKSVEGTRNIGARGGSGEETNLMDLSDEEFLKKSNELAQKSPDLNRTVSVPPQK